MKSIPLKITNEAPGQRMAEVFIYDTIGEDFFGGLSSKNFADQLQALGSLDTIIVRINSPGGSVFDGNAIYNVLKNHPARVVVEIEGLAASAASYIAMAGDEINADENAFLMIHQAQGFAMGPESEMRKMADTLDKMDGQIAKTYADRTNRKPDTFMRMMRDETWFTADEARAQRLVDSVRPNKAKPAMANFAPEVLNCISKRPDKIAALLTPAGPDDPPADLNSEDDDGPEDPLTNGTSAKEIVGRQIAEEQDKQEARIPVALANYAARVASLEV